MIFARRSMLGFNYVESSTLCFPRDECEYLFWSVLKKISKKMVLRPLVIYSANSFVSTQVLGDSAMQH